MAGCGEEGVAEGATLSVYVSQPLCGEARAALREADSKAGDFSLRAVCVNDSGGRGDARLAAIGAAARQATEDSSSIAYVGTPARTAIRFSEPILEEADLIRISNSSGKAAVSQLLEALERVSDAGSLRPALSDELR